MRAQLAYLIMVHQHPGQLARLVRALDGSQASFFVHVDARVDVSPFVTAIGPHPRVRFVEPRVRCEWMGFSLVEATLAMMEAALERSFRYCILLSGADFPIKSNSHLQAFYSDAQEEYIAFWRLVDRPSWLHKVRYWYPIDRVPIRGWSTGTETVYWRRLFWGRFFKYQHLMPHRRFIKGWVPYGGPDWWSLSEACARHVVEAARSHSALMSFFRHTASPGELFFQTVVLNSPFAERVHNRAAYLTWSAQGPSGEGAPDRPMLPESAFNYRYTDWSGESTGQRECPAVLDDRDWEALRDTPCHFARKFDPQRSAALLDHIDRELLAHDAEALRE